MKPKIWSATLLLVFKILFIGAISQSIAVAADKAKCDQYANEAVAQQNTNIKNSCGFESPGWHDNYDMHFQWCLSAKTESVDEQITLREEQLKHCLVKKIKPQPEGIKQIETPKPDFWTKEKFCEEYAKAAILQAEESKELKCGHDSDIWSADQDYHYNWCMTNNESTVKYQFSARQDALKKCKDKNICQNYAKTAVDQNHKNEQDGCGYQDAEWSSSFLAHYDWCMSGDNKFFADKLTKKRNTLLAKCALIKPLDGSFKINKIEPSLDKNGELGQVKIIIEADSSQEWAVGDFGHKLYGALWIEVKTTNLETYRDSFEDREYNHIFSIRGIPAGTQSLVSPPIGTTYPKGKHKIEFIVHPGYPYIRLSAIQTMWSEPGGLFQPGGLGCWHFYPEISAKVHIFTTSGFKHDTKVIEIGDAPLTTVYIKNPETEIRHICR